VQVFSNCLTKYDKIMENEMHQSDDNKFIPMSSIKSGSGTAVRDDIYYYTNQIVNVIMIGASDSESWVLVDAGMPMCGPEIVTVAENRYGKGTKPQAIILTHGHFDHVGGIVHLIEKWQVPVYAHPLEAPFLTGSRSYPEPDPTVEGGMLAKMSSIYPIEPIDIAPVLMPLPLDGSVPHLDGWKWIHTPGHSPGQIALFRESDRTLLAADAFVTVRQDSFYKVLIQKKEVNGPPRYLTTDWQEAWESVRILAALKPALVIAGHGQAMEGEELMQGLEDLARDFRKKAIPGHGKYVNDDRGE
jgi:glyoxylase-like metal-dependent hydrolase (beta-lactamase superfamily II)